MVDKQCGHGIAVRLLIAAEMRLPVIKSQDFSIRQAEQNRRMGDDDELCSFICTEIYFPQIGKLSLRRKRRFRLVEEIETIGAKIVFRKGKEAFAV